MAFTENLMSVLTFKKDGMGKLANDTGATVPAILIVLLQSLIGSLPVLNLYLKATTDAQKTIYAGSLITAFFLTLLIFFVLSGIMAFVLRGFGGTATMIQSLRVYGFTSVFGLIGSILDLTLSVVSPSTNLGFSLSFLLGLVGLVAFIIALTSFSGLGIGSAIFAVIIAYIIALIIAFVLVFILIILLVAIIVAAL